MSQPLVGMDLADLSEALGPDQPGYRARQIYEALYRGQATDLVQISTLPAGMRQELAGRHAFGLPTVDRLYESTDGTRRYLLRLADGRTVETVLMPEGERDTICISSQVGCPVDCKFCMTALHGPGAQPDRRRNRRPGAAGGARKSAPPRWRPPQYRHDGAGRAAAEPAQCPESDPHSARPGRLRSLAAPDHRLHRRDHPQDRRTRPRAGPPEAGDLAERLHRRAAAGADADHPQIPPQGSDGGLQSLPAAPLGETDFRIRAAARRQRHRCGRAPGGQTARQPQCQGEPDRAQSRTRNSVRHACSRSASPASRRSSAAGFPASCASREGSISTPPAASSRAVRKPMPGSPRLSQKYSRDAFPPESSRGALCGRACKECAVRTPHPACAAQ